MIEAWQVHAHDGMDISLVVHSPMFWSIGQLNKRVLMLDQEMNLTTCVSEVNRAKTDRCWQELQQWFGRMPEFIHKT